MTPWVPPKISHPEGGVKKGVFHCPQTSRDCVAMFAIRFQSVCMYDSNPDILGQYPSTVTTHGDFSQPSTVPPEHQNSFHNQSNTTSISTTYTPYHDEHSPIVRLHLQTVCLPWKLTHPAARTWLLIMLQIPISCLLPASTN